MDSNRVSQRGVELFNYADSRLGARISCDYPSTNGYEVESLICKQASSQASSQQLLSHSLSIPQTGNGFMAESFVKPPVEVTIHIPYAVSLAAIVINPRIRVHTAKVVTVFVQSSGRDRWEMLGRMVWQDAQNARPSGMCNKELGPQTILAAASQFASSICSSTSISAWTPIERQPGVLHSVKSIRLRISSMHGATILGLGGVEIWGQPSRALPPQTRTQLGTEAHQALQNDRTKPGVAAGSSQHGSSEPLADIPAEFVD
ncbi:RING finger protein 37, partial [Dipsacomyces acuminosporus]